MDEHQGGTTALSIKVAEKSESDKKSGSGGKAMCDGRPRLWLRDICMIGALCVFVVMTAGAIRMGGSMHAKAMSVDKVSQPGTEGGFMVNAVFADGHTKYQQLPKDGVTGKYWYAYQGGGLPDTDLCYSAAEFK